MARATTKKDLLDGAILKYEELNTIIENMTEKQCSTEFDFSMDEKKKEAHWKRDKNLRDIYIHLYEWQQLLLNWVASNQKGESKTFLPSPYNWKSYQDMNIMFWEKHQQTTLKEAVKLFEKSHNDTIVLAECFSNEQLFSKNAYSWAKGSVLGSYFISTTISHYDWAIKKLKAHRKNCKD